MKILCKYYNSRIELIFCKDHEDGTKPTSEEIIKCIEEEFIGKFNPEEYEYSDDKPISDENTFITKSTHNAMYVWEVLNEVDYVNHNNDLGRLYGIRKIGRIIGMSNNDNKKEEYCHVVP